MVHYRLVYNKLRWLAEPIRLMFVYAGEEFEDVRLDWDEFHKAKLGRPSFFARRIWSDVFLT